ncbi:MAG: hypothetical protein IT536_21565 [Hyphomicrobiales bacterium]|nr:hypothetical protein [Hyphomicrobiales bacterium]
MMRRTIFTALATAMIGGLAFGAQAQSSNTPPAPKPAAGALPQPNPNAVQRTFRTQTGEEQKSSAQTTPMDVGQAGRSRSPN